MCPFEACVFKDGVFRRLWFLSKESNHCRLCGEVVNWLMSGGQDMFINMDLNSSGAVELDECPC